MGRLLQFRTELMMLWRAFIAPQTPVWIKGLMLLVPLYLLSPVDFVPDVIPVLGWLDDLVIVPLMVSWIVSLLPQPQPVRAQAYNPRRDDNPTIDGDWRRL
ncbi:MAG: DUF1232 domain-containing protein [Hyphomicrobiales bacterium]|nr:MAG: DUF1232 domain-containing protein [Hyphomicrobiales bacterium]